MKKILILFAFTFIIISACATYNNTTYYLIRHAEKDRTSGDSNPNLNHKGKQRAKKWAAYFKDIDLDAVYATNYNRTMQTAAAVANAKDLKIVNYDPKEMYTDDFKKETTSKKVLIVGHSNTTPIFANKILGEKKYEWMQDDDNSSLYIVTVSKRKKTSTVKKVN